MIFKMLAMGVSIFNDEQTNHLTPLSLHHFEGKSGGHEYNRMHQTPYTSIILHAAYTMGQAKEHRT